MSFKSLIYILFLVFTVVACRNELGGGNKTTNLEHIEYNPTPKELSANNDLFPDMEIPQDNPTTVEGIALGRRLFYDPILSADSTMTCASCHLQTSNFADNLAFSNGIDGKAGKRSSMSLINIGFTTDGLFWDGSSPTLESQALLPVEDPLELHDDWGNVVEKLVRSTYYPALFREAFGIKDTDGITKELTAKALAQFERTLISSESKFDRVPLLDVFTEEEQLGFEIFFDLNPDEPDAECGHCHNRPLMTTNEYENNGLDAVDDLDDFVDKGRGLVTNLKSDNGKFKIPTLRNIEYTAPYMHDGRFQTLEEVIEHYNSGGNYALNVNPLIVPLNLEERHKAALIAFMKTLSDKNFINNPDFSDPN